jgi:hypothetical protein
MIQSTLNKSPVIRNDDFGTNTNFTITMTVSPESCKFSPPVMMTLVLPPVTHPSDVTPVPSANSTIKMTPVLPRASSFTNITLEPPKSTVNSLMQPYSPKNTRQKLKMKQRKSLGSLLCIRSKLMNYRLLLMLMVLFFMKTNAMEEKLINKSRLKEMEMTRRTLQAVNEEQFVEGEIVKLEYKFEEEDEEDDERKNMNHTVLPLYQHATWKKSIYGIIMDKDASKVRILTKIRQLETKKSNEFEISTLQDKNFEILHIKSSDGLIKRKLFEAGDRIRSTSRFITYYGKKDDVSWIDKDTIFTITQMNKEKEYWSMQISEKTETKDYWIAEYNFENIEILNKKHFLLKILETVPGSMAVMFIIVMVLCTNKAKSDPVFLWTQSFIPLYFSMFGFLSYCSQKCTRFITTHIESTHVY